MKIWEIDENFKAPSSMSAEHMEIYAATEKPVSTHGVFYENGMYRRLPENVAKEISSGVTVLHSMTAGGRFKFRTDSKNVALFIENMPFLIAHQTLLGSSGFEIYADGKFAKAVFLSLDSKPQLDPVEKYSGAAGLVIGLSLTLVQILGIYFTGTSVNPARSFGPALFVGGDALANVWVFIAAPLVGGVLPALVYKFLSSDKK